MKTCSFNNCTRVHHAKGFCDKHYRKDMDSFLSKLYKNMKQRVQGVQNNKSHIYLGLELIEKSKFIEWAKNNTDFIFLFANWVKLGYTRTDTPSIDRINSSKGYTIDNIRWITNSLNCSYGATSYKRYEN